jgi:phosphatidylinositol kinase/protein kinase (PI-3  family)
VTSRVGNIYEQRGMFIVLCAFDRNNINSGYEKANSSNLPYVDMMMVAAFFATNDKFVAAELRGVKNEVSEHTILTSSSKVHLLFASCDDYQTCS